MAEFGFIKRWELIRWQKPGIKEVQRRLLERLERWGVSDRRDRKQIATLMIAHATRMYGNGMKQVRYVIDTIPPDEVLEISRTEIVGACTVHFSDVWGTYVQVQVARQRQKKKPCCHRISTPRTQRRFCGRA